MTTENQASALIFKKKTSWLSLRWWFTGEEPEVTAQQVFNQPLPAYALQFFDLKRSVCGELVDQLDDTTEEAKSRHLLKQATAAELATLTKEPITWSKLYLLDMLILKLRPDDQLPFEAPQLRSRLAWILAGQRLEDSMPIATGPHQTPQDTQPTQLADNQTAPTVAPNKLRYELSSTIEQIHYQYALTNARLATRTDLGTDIARAALWWALLSTAFGALIWFMNGTIPSDSTDDGSYQNIVLTLYSAAMLGTLGGYMSVNQRLQALPFEGDALHRIIVVRRGWLSLYLSPVFGSIFAVLAYFVFASQLVRGDFFPEFFRATTDTTHPTLRKAMHMLKLNDEFDYPKLFLWSFVIGFAERFIPDSLTQLIKKKGQTIVDKASK